MNQDVRKLLVVLGIATVILYLVGKKEKKASADKLAPPQVAPDDKKKIQDGAVIGLQAMREAINNGESRTELDKLSGIILKEHGVKVIVSKSNGLLKAMDKSGKLIAEEELNK